MSGFFQGSEIKLIIRREADIIQSSKYQIEPWIGGFLAQKLNYAQTTNQSQA